MFTYVICSLGLPQSKILATPMINDESDISKLDGLTPRQKRFLKKVLFSTLLSGWCGRGHTYKNAYQKEHYFFIKKKSVKKNEKSG